MLRPEPQCFSIAAKRVYRTHVPAVKVCDKDLRPSARKASFIGEKSSQEARLKVYHMVIDVGESCMRRTKRPWRDARLGFWATERAAHKVTHANNSNHT